MYHGFKKIYKRHQLFFPREMRNVSLLKLMQICKKITDANKGDKHSSKLVCKFQHTEQDAFLK